MLTIERVLQNVFANALSTCFVSVIIVLRSFEIFCGDVIAYRLCKEGENGENQCSAVDIQVGAVTKFPWLPLVTRMT